MLNGMKKLGAMALLGVLALTGCASAQPVNATPTPTVNPNAEACSAFEDATMQIGAAFDAGSTDDEWEDVRVAVDEAALQAEGEVADRMSELVDNWPTAGDIFIYREFETFNDPAESIARACEADGATIEPNTFVTQ
jgi:osmotically-inducible protein OsmY